MLFFSAIAAATTIQCSPCTGSPCSSTLRYRWFIPFCASTWCAHPKCVAWLALSGRPPSPFLASPFFGHSPEYSPSCFCSNIRLHWVNFCVFSLLPMSRWPALPVYIQYWVTHRIKFAFSVYRSMFLTVASLLFPSPKSDLSYGSPVAVFTLDWERGISGESQSLLVY